MRKSMISTSLFALVISAAACNQSQKQTTENRKQIPDSTSNSAMYTPSNDTVKKIAIREADLADKKDPVCGMPAFRYMKDTALFNNKIYAFCSDECKREFVKNPAEYVKADKLKK